MTPFPGGKLFPWSVVILSVWKGPWQGRGWWLTSLALCSPERVAELHNMTSADQPASPGRRRRGKADRSTAANCRSFVELGIFAA